MSTGWKRSRKRRAEARAAACQSFPPSTSARYFAASARASDANVTSLGLGLGLGLGFGLGLGLGLGLGVEFGFGFRFGLSSGSGSGDLVKVDGVGVQAAARHLLVQRLGHGQARRAPRRIVLEADDPSRGGAWLVVRVRVRVS